MSTQPANLQNETLRESGAMSISFHPRVVELMASHICHDLVSPTGAIANGIELLEEMGADAGADAMELIAHSAEQAAIRLRVFRLAYAAGGSDTNVTLGDVREVFAAWLGDGRVKLEWEVDKTTVSGDMPRGLPKILLNLLLMASEASPQQGVISLEGGIGPDSSEIKISVSGDNPELHVEMIEALEGKISPEQLTPKLVQPYIAGQLAVHFGLEFGYEKPEQGVAVLFVRS